MKQTARNAAVTALLQVQENEGYSNIVLDKTLRKFALSPRDGALASILFYGVLERKLTLDYYLSRCLSDPGKKQDEAVLAVLRCGAYQLLFLDRLPESAVVNEAVETIKELGKQRLSGFVNGVLRGLARKKETITLPQGNAPAALSIRYSVPVGLISLWRASYGESFTERLLEAFNTRADTYIRINSCKTSGATLAEALQKEGAELSFVEGFPNTGILSFSGAPILLPSFQQGGFHVQDLSAQIVCELLAPQPGETVCDCCAAPGGKAFTLAQQMANKGKVYALDLYKGRVNLIREGAQRLGLSSVETAVHDALQEFQDFPEVDRMLCDVPCSGFGVIRRKPEIRYKEVSSVAELPKLQSSILQTASRKVKSGGMLLYSTCTLHPAENAAVAERFLAKNTDFVPETLVLPAGLTRVLEEPEHMATMTPFSGASDGFFVAAFRRK